MYKRLKIIFISLVIIIALLAISFCTLSYVNKIKKDNKSGDNSIDKVKVYSETKDTTNEETERETIIAVEVETVEKEQNKSELFKEKVNNSAVKLQRDSNKNNTSVEVSKADDAVINELSNPTSSNEQKEVQAETKEEKIYTNENITMEPKEEEVKIEEETQEKEEVKIPEEKYVENQTMIDTMKLYIEKNPSDIMIQYGYEVVVDSSIIEDTNQFTYTEYRLKNKIARKFGTIRIYARDYYYNGQFMYTECYII